MIFYRPQGALLLSRITRTWLNRLTTCAARPVSGSRLSVMTMGTLALMTLMAGCATPPAQDVSERTKGQWAAQQDALAAQDTWSLTGKVGLRMPEQTTSASLDWQQQPEDFKLMVSGPFGAGRSVLEKQDGSFSLTTGEGHFEADSPEALMTEQLGWSLPVSAMPDWIRGRPSPATPYRIDFDASGFPDTLRQNGWELNYRDWTQAHDFWLPRRLVMQAGDVRVTLIASQWQHPTP